MTAAQAAFANGVLAHSLDYDDTHLPSVLHPSASVVPAALAAAEHAGASGEQVVRAVAVGLEVAVRLGMAGYDEQLGNSVFFEHGQHATSITGAMGSAVAASLLYGADEKGVVDALGLTASMASGVIEANRTGGTVKRLHCGLAAQAGVTAAQLVRRGFTGPPTVLEGRFGFFEAWLHGQFFPDAVTDGLGDDWSVPGIFFKPYPANHFTHTSIDAGRAFRERGVRPEDVASITIGAPTAVIRTIGQPIEVKRAPETGYQAQFSGPYAVTAGPLRRRRARPRPRRLHRRARPGPRAPRGDGDGRRGARRALRRDLPLPVPGGRHPDHHVRRGAGRGGPHQPRRPGPAAERRRARHQVPRQRRGPARRRRRGRRTPCRRDLCATPPTSPHLLSPLSTLTRPRSTR